MVGESWQTFDAEGNLVAEEKSLEHGSGCGVSQLMMTLAELEESGAYDGATLPQPYLFGMTTGLQVFPTKTVIASARPSPVFQLDQGLTETDRERMVRRSITTI